VHLVPSIAGAPRDRASRHAVGIGGVLLIHLLLLAALIAGNPKIIRVLPSGREIILTFVRKPVLQQTPTPPKTTRAPVRTALPLPWWQAPVFPVTPQAEAMPSDRQDLGIALFGCAPENIVNLTREQRSLCNSVPAMEAYAGGLPGTMRVRSKDGAIWAAAVAEKQAPPRIPCVGLQNRPVNGITGKTGLTLMWDVPCVAGLALKALKKARVVE
jgi:hypothetical protein